MAGCSTSVTLPPSAAIEATPAVVVTACTNVNDCEWACRQDRSRSCTQLAHMYETGQGAPQNLPRAAALYAEACDGGQVEACTHLAMMYDIGLGVARDIGKAAFFYERACALGDAWPCARNAELGPNAPLVRQPPQPPQ